jgi:demethylmenaquinone methyltransferase/2-methoxy-6-polyprenyl-1,4-benzoquinol methylase
MAGNDPELRIAPLPHLRKYYRSAEARPAFVAEVFDGSARGYDRASAVLSFGTDKSYRRRALVEHGAKARMTILDVGCGTGLVAGPARDIVGPDGIVIGLDPSSAMLREGVERGRVTHPVRGLGEALPFASETFDFVCMGYALRHVSDLVRTFREFHRVLRPGGTVLLLEITEPSGAWSRLLHRFYMRWIVPLAAGAVTLSPPVARLMTFYSDTIANVVSPATVLGAMEAVGFERSRRDIKLGVFSEYVGQRRGARG